MVLRDAIAFLILFSVTLLPCSAVHAERRVALVIGNGSYAKVSKLSNPTRDADAMAALFRSAAFDVVEVKRDLGVAAMRRALRDFSDHVRDADIAVVSFAGHGIEVSGTNYLVPVDAVLERDIDVEDETVSLDRVTQILEQAKRLRLVILDACRDNPFARDMKRTVASRSIGRGLAEVRVLTADTLVAFAAKAGSTAADGEGANSPYTLALARHLTTPGLDVRLALGRVRDEVLKNTASRQEPFVYGSLGGAEIALVSNETKKTPLAQPPSPAPHIRDIIVHDADRVAGVIKERRFVVPEFQFEKPAEGAPVQYGHFLGVWASNVGFNGGTGRQAILLITKIVGTDQVNGLYGWGPATGKSYDQVPAGAIQFVGNISGNSIMFDFGSKLKFHNTAARDANNRIQLTQTRSDGNTARITLEPVWTPSGGAQPSKR